MICGEGARMIALSQMTGPPRFRGRASHGGRCVTPKSLPLLLALSGFAAVLPGVAAAQDDADAMIAASQQVDTGMALAGRQIGARDLLGALGTLERVLFAHPEAVPPRLLYASLLCRVDDAEGATVELSQLGGQQIADADWAIVTAACGQVPRPGPTHKGKKR